MFPFFNCWDNTVRGLQPLTSIAVPAHVCARATERASEHAGACVHCSFEKFVTVTASPGFLTSPVMLKISAASVAVTPYQHSFLKFMLANIQKPILPYPPLPGGQK